MASTGVSNSELVRRTFELINTHDVEALRPMWTEETFEQFPDRTCRGADEMAAYFGELFAAMPDVRMDVQAVAVDRDDAFVRWRLTGTHTGAAFSGIEPTGKRIELDGIDHFVIRDGKVATNFVVFDQMQVARALGMLPPQDSPADRAVKAAFNAKNRAVAAIRGVRNGS